jgi:hypothetical protein
MSSGDVNMKDDSDDEMNHGFDNNFDIITNTTQVNDVITNTEVGGVDKSPPRKKSVPDSNTDVASGTLPSTPTSSQNTTVIDTTQKKTVEDLYAAVLRNNSTSNSDDLYLKTLVEGFSDKYNDYYLNSMADYFISNNIHDYSLNVGDDFNIFMSIYDKSNANYSAAYDYLFESLKRKIDRRIKISLQRIERSVQRIENYNSIRIKNIEIKFEDVLRRFNSETILFSIAETKPSYEEIRGALGIDAYSVEKVEPKKLKESIKTKPDILKYLNDMYTAGSGIDGGHDAETVMILELLRELNDSNVGLKEIINKMTCMQSPHSFNPKKAINDLEKLIADVESKFRHFQIPFMEETTEYVPLELYSKNTKVSILLGTPGINTIQESGRSFGNSLFEISTACFDAGTRKILEDQWIENKLYKIENVYSVNYMFIADAEYKKNHVFACIDDHTSDRSYWNYYVITGEVSLNNVLDIFELNSVEDFKHARRGNCTEKKDHSDESKNISTQYKKNGSAVLPKNESDELWNRCVNGSMDENILGSLFDQLQKYGRTNLFKTNARLAKLLFFSLKGVGDASVESFYQEKVIEGTIQTLLDSEEVKPFTDIKQIVTISTLNTVDSFLERLIRLAYLCGKIDYSPPRIRPVAGGGIVTYGDASMSDEQIQIIKNKNNLLKYVLSIETSEKRRDYLMEQFGLDQLRNFISDNGTTTWDPKMKTIILPVLGEFYRDRITKLDKWLKNVGSSTYDNVDEELKVNLDNLLSLSGDIGSILNEYDEYTNDIVKIPSRRDKNVLFGEEDDDEVMEEETVKGAISPEKVTQGSTRRPYIKVIVNKEEDSFILELPNNNYNERITRIIKNFKQEMNSDAYAADDVLGLEKINGKSCLKFKSSIELFINMYRRFKSVQVEDLCNSARSDALDFFTNIIVERLQKYSTKDKESLNDTVRDALLLADTALEGTSGGGKNMTRKKRLTKKRLKRKRITKKKNKTLRPIKLTKKRNKKSKKHKTYKKM